LEVHQRSCKSGKAAKPISSTGSDARRPDTSHGRDGHVSKPKNGDATDPAVRRVSQSVDTGKKAKPSPTAQQRVLQQLSFDDVDVNGDGMIDKDELKTVLKEIGFQASEEEVTTFLGLYDTDDDGKINLADWESANFGEKILEFTGASPAQIRKQRDPRFARQGVDMNSRSCTQCQTVEYDSGAKFCQECGTVLPKDPGPVLDTPSKKTVCATCGDNLNADQKFCTSCGTAVARAQSPSTAKAPPPPPPGTCNNCGNANPVESKFCEECGTSLNGPIRQVVQSGGGDGGKWNRNPLVNRLPEVSAETTRTAPALPHDDDQEGEENQDDDDGDNEGVEDDREPCPNCGRKFYPERLPAHEKVCRAQKKRATFNAAKHRIQGTEMVGCQRTKEVAKQQSNWKDASNALRDAMKESRRVTTILANGGNVKDLPPPTYSENKHYVACPHCQRRFAPDTAEKHIPKCAGTVNRPKPPPKRR
jgi:hypothetical protein